MNAVPANPESKFVVVLNQSYGISEMLSAFGHVTAGLVGSQAGNIDPMQFLDHTSADNEKFCWISNWSFVVLKARGGQMKTLRQSLLSFERPCVTYLDTMFEGGTEIELKATGARNYEELSIVALATFGERSVIDPLTKKFSLWR